MDLSSVVEGIVGAIKAFLATGAIEKLLDSLVNAAPFIENVVNGIVG